MRAVVRIAGAVVLAAGVFAAAAVGPFRSRAGDGGEAASGRPVVAADAGSLLTPIVSGSLDRTISSLQARLRALPTDWTASASLGLAYVQQARITTDPSYYAKAEGILRRSLELNDDDNDAAFVGMAALAAARHEFAEALRWGERAKAVDPYDSNVYGVVGDALVELGRYDEAFDAFQRMVDRRPGLASFARVAYARELRGDVAGATLAMRSAAELAGTPADAGWASYQLGELYWGSGRIDRAAAAYRHAARLGPSFVLPRASLARVAWARGDLAAAIRGYVWVTRRSPSPEHVIALGDLYTLAGDTEAAARQYDLVRAEEELLRASGVNLDLEQALFEADHGDPRAALRAARAEWGRRRSIHVADAMAWALYANGHYREAATFSDRALALGTRNASFLFHAGMIRWRMGDAAGAARFLRDALETNPFFSIQHANVAERILDRVEGSR